MYKYNLKCNPELARERHNAQKRAWYRRNKEKCMEYQREYRKRRRGETVTITYTTEIHDYNNAMESLKSLKQKGML